MTSKLRSTTPIREFIFQSLYYEANEAFEMDHRTAANEWLALKYAIIFKLGESESDPVAHPQYISSNW